MPKEHPDSDAIVAQSIRKSPSALFAILTENDDVKRRRSEKQSIDELRVSLSQRGCAFCPGHGSEKWNSAQQDSCIGMLSLTLKPTCQCCVQSRTCTLVVCTCQAVLASCGAQP